MHLSDLLSGVELVERKPHFEDTEITGISCDTRTMKPGDLFVALRGRKTDGHRYIGEALRRGAAAIVCDDSSFAPCRDRCPVVPVKDSRAALARISASWYHHPASELTVIGVTGTNGKTTTTTLLKEVIEDCLSTKAGLIGTNQVLIGSERYPADRTTPESLDIQRWLRRMADAHCTHVVMEVSSHALALHRTDGIRFAVGAFTNLTRDHLDFHGTMEDYRAAKEKLFGQCNTAVLNLDDGAGRYYRERVSCPCYTYSERHDEADLTARNLRIFHDHVEFEAVSFEEIARVFLGIPGSFTVYNALCSLACAHCLGIPLKRGAEALRHAKGVRGRMEVADIGSHPGTVIIDYAHSPDALENVLTSLRRFTAPAGGRLICLFGCGGDRDRGKRPLMGQIAAQLADVVIVTSDNPRTEDPASIIGDILTGITDRTGCIVEPDRVRAIGLGLALLKEGDTLLLAGKGHETDQEIRGEKIHLDEREVLSSFLGEAEPPNRDVPSLAL